MYFQVNVFPNLYLHVYVKETTFCHLKHQTHFGARRDFVEETFFRMSIDVNEITLNGR